MSEKNNDRSLTRRRLVQRGAMTTAAIFVAGCAADGVQGPAATTTSAPEATGAPVAQAATATSASEVTSESGATAEPSEPTAVEPPVTLEPTPWCDDDDEPTVAQTAGPFYTPDTPERTSFIGDGAGTRLVVSGQVVDTSCAPIAGALIDFWHADDAGNYDNSGYNFRGHQFTDSDGNYRLETIVPGLYPGRTRHIHVIVQGPEQPQLTTQLYFPGEPDNARDGIYQELLLMEVSDEGDGMDATFDFVLA